MSVNGVPITFAGHGPKQDVGLVRHVLLSGPAPKGLGKPSDVGVRRDSGRSPGWSCFRGAEGGAVMGAGANFLGLTQPICAVGMRAPGLPGGRPGPSLDSCQQCRLWSYLLPLAQASGGHWNSWEAHRNQAKRSGARREEEGERTEWPASGKLAPPWALCSQ